MHIQEMNAGDLDRIREIDRSESVRFLYVHEQGELRRVERKLEIPTWDDARIEEEKGRLGPKFADGGVLLGAFDSDELAGVVVLGGEFIGLRSNQLEVAFLYVSNGHRRRGVARSCWTSCAGAPAPGADSFGRYSVAGTDE